MVPTTMVRLDGDRLLYVWVWELWRLVGAGYSTEELSVSYHVHTESKRRKSIK